MKGMQLDRLPEYNGALSWNTKTLMSNIKRAKPSYDVYDPGTWPRVTKRSMREFYGKSWDGLQKLPYFVAYDRSIVEKYMDCTPLKKDGSVQGNGIGMKYHQEMKVVFHVFPYHYDRYGKKRQHPLMTRTEQLQYTQMIRGPASAEKAVQIEKKVSGFKPTTKSAVSRRIPSPATMFQDIYRWVDQRGSEIAEIQSVKEELKNAKETLSQEKEQANFTKTNLKMHYKSYPRCARI